MSIEDYINDVESHRLSKLTELCVSYNNSIMESAPENAIDLIKYNTSEMLIFNLWYHEVDVGVLGFGYPYDDMIKDWVPEVEDEVENKIESNKTYLSYVHSDRIPYFLYYSLYLMKDIREPTFTDREKLTKNVIKFNDILNEIGKSPISDYRELRQLLVSGTFTKIELCCLLWKCESENLIIKEISVSDMLDDIINN